MDTITWVDWVKLGLITISLALNIFLLIPVIDRWLYRARLRKKFKDMNDEEWKIWRRH